MTMDVVTLGRALVDLYPEQDGPLTAVRSFEQHVGGSPANVAVAAARLGRRTAIAAAVGDDPFGRVVARELVDSGVDAALLQTAPGRHTPIAFCEIDGADVQADIYRPAPASDSALAWTSELEAAIADAGVVWITGSGLSEEPSRSTHERAIAARRRGILALDLDFRPGYWPDVDDAGAAASRVLPDIDLVVGNLQECRIVTGATTPIEAAEALLARGVGSVVVKDGARGAFVATAAGLRAAIAPFPIRLVNGIGSGDAFGGALCHTLLDGRPLDEAARFAAAAGAVVASRRGCSSAMPTLSDVTALLNEAPNAA